MNTTRVAVAVGRDERYVIGGGDVVRIVVGTTDTEGRYCVVEERTPPGGGPRPHRHDFAETFHVLAGRVKFSYRGTSRIENVTAEPGMTVTISPNVVHTFTNIGEVDAVQLVVASPGELDDFFAASGVPTTAGTTDEASEYPERERVLAAAAAHGITFEELAPS